MKVTKTHTNMQTQTKGKNTKFDTELSAPNTPLKALQNKKEKKKKSFPEFFFVERGVLF